MRTPAAISLSSSSILEGERAEKVWLRLAAQYFVKFFLENEVSALIELSKPTG